MVFANTSHRRQTPSIRWYPWLYLCSFTIKFTIGASSQTTSVHNDEYLTLLFDPASSGGGATMSAVVSWTSEMPSLMQRKRPPWGGRGLVMTRGISFAFLCASLLSAPLSFCHLTLCDRSRSPPLQINSDNLPLFHFQHLNQSVKRRMYPYTIVPIFVNCL